MTETGTKTDTQHDKAHEARPAEISREPLAQAVLGISEAAIGRDHLTLGEITRAIGAQGPSLAAALLTLPFLQPIPLPGLSTPVGLTIALSGVAVFMNREVLLPSRLSNVSLPASSILKTTELLARLEVKLKPYLNSSYSFDPVFTRHILGAMIALHGFLLALPLPVPMSNMLPAWACFIAAMTVLFASRRLFVGSILILLLNIAFWTMLIFTAQRGSSSLVEWLGLR